MSIWVGDDDGDILGNKVVHFVIIIGRSARCGSNGGNKHYLSVMICANRRRRRRSSSVKSALRAIVVVAAAAAAASTATITVLRERQHEFMECQSISSQVCHVGSPPGIIRTVDTGHCLGDAAADTLFSSIPIAGGRKS